VTGAAESVANAFVSATGPAGHGATVADHDGAFSMSLPNGTYHVAANAPGYSGSVQEAVSVTGPTTRDLTLTPSGAPLAPVPVYGGGLTAAADGTPGVFYIAGGTVGGLFRSVDWGGNWTKVNVVADDPVAGLPETGYPETLATSGQAGEVATILHRGDAYYSTDYGVTWSIVADTPDVSRDDFHLFWGHAGSRSVLLLQDATTGALYTASMNDSYPAFVRMTDPYGDGKGPIGVGDGAQRPWLATADSRGNVSIYPLIAGAAAPAPLETVGGFATDPVALGLGGRSTRDEPPSGILVSGEDRITMSVKQPDEERYPTPAAIVDPTGTTSGICPQPHALFGSLADRTAAVSTNTGSSYGAGWAQGCWVQDINGDLEVNAVEGSAAAIDAGYDASNVSPGSNAVVLMAKPLVPGGTQSPFRGVAKLAENQGGFPVALSDLSKDASSGTQANSSGIAVNGITAQTAYETAPGPASNEVAVATDAGGAASDDGGASFHRATSDTAWSAAWWQGASGTWLLFGGAAYVNQPNLLSGFENWASSTPPVSGGNVAGATALELQAPVAPIASPTVDAIAGVPGEDTAFLGLSIDSGNSGSCTCDEGAIRRVSLASGPAVTSVTPIAEHVITKPGPIAYCPATSTPEMRDTLLVLGEDYYGGGLYLVSGATGAGPSAKQLLALPGTGGGAGWPALQVNCATGLIVAASGAPSDPLYVSTDGGTSFERVPVTDPDATAATIRAIGLTPGALLVGDSAGFIQRSTDLGETWTVVNDPATGVNLAADANLSGGIYDLTAVLGGNLQPSNGGALATRIPSETLVAGPGEYAGDLLTTARNTLPVLKGFKSTHRRFQVSGRNTAVLARKRRTPRGTRFSYNVSVEATLAVFFTRELPGRLFHGHCTTPTKRNAHHARCVVYRYMPVGLIRRSSPGSHAVAFSGRIGNVKFPAGNYLAAAIAQTRNGRRSLPRFAKFTIVR
jgi:hypothetical protein